MSLFITHKDTNFGIGDKVKVVLKVKEGAKERSQAFEGIVIAAKGSHGNRTFTVRKIGVHNVGIERIFQLGSPFLESVSVVKKGTAGVRRAKLYYTRHKSAKEIEEIYSRAKTKSKK
ncbi:50S ribosomal protein L19 [Candidatus Woesebacteria bacterium RIFOXYD1_FULL_40_21]|uniref:50S ribosomal protein L19 n=1 Tax=Candidatus Woesebacteria bacterium RIFOXYD1_FULL_40_21 TaxID=1802549 RepID=A0A1F8DGB2_9BACT|nr:MAG: 50S ribosomal protein L19 [Candidatus Woesebacteria bacterium RIFOXYD1_FULL_40_21]